MFDGLLRDLRYAARILRKTPAVSAVVILSLGLGIGANTAIFSLIDSVMLRSLPVTDPDELVLFPQRLPYPRYEQFRDRNEVLAAVTAVVALDQVTASTSGSERGVLPERVAGRLVSGSYFGLLGVGAAHGRSLTPDDDRIAGAHPVVVISHDFWERRFGLDPGVLGRTIRLGPGRLVWGAMVGGEDSAPAAQPVSGGVPFTIVGVLPAGFHGETIGDRPDFWAPMAMQAQLMPGRAWLGKRNAGWIRMMGRRKPGVEFDRAAASLNLLFQQLRMEDAGSNVSEEVRRRIRETRLEVSPGARGFPREEHAKNMVASVAEFAQPLLILMAVVGVVLLIACANVANLLLARSAARQKEMAVRLAVGAGPRRLFRQMLAESVLLALLGGAAGLLLAGWGTRLLMAGVADYLSTPIAMGFRPDARVLAFTAAVALLTGILFGLAPALRASRVDLAATLKDSARSAGSAGGRFALRKLLVVTQVALSLLLLVGGGLFLRTLHNLWQVELGYDRENIVVVRLDPATSGYRAADVSRLAARLLDALAAVPGVRAVTFSENGLFNGPESMGPAAIEGDTERARFLRFDQVGPGYFTTVGIPLLLGRELTESDHANAPRVAVVNEALAKRFFPGQNPVGKRLFWLPRNRAEIQIVGVARNAQDHSLRWGPISRFYVPLDQALEPPSTLIFEVRCMAEPKSVMMALRQAVARVDATLPVLGVETLDARLDRSLLDERMIAWLGAFFAGLALLLASIGLYGVMSYGVARRTGEIGVRLALGAQPPDILRMVLRETVVLVGIGIAIGLPAALAAARLVASRLYGLEPADPWTVAVALVVMLAVAGFAGYLPARRAARVDPIVALRYE